MLPKSRFAVLDVTELPDGLRVLDASTGGSHELRPLGAFVFRHADGHTSVSDLAAQAAAALGQPVDEQAVWGVLDDLTAAGLLEERAAPPAAQRRVARREVLSRMAIGTAAATAGMVVLADRMSAAPANSEQQAKHATAKEQNAKVRAERQEQDEKQAAARQEQHSKRSQERSEKRHQRLCGRPLELLNGWENVGDPYAGASSARAGRLVVLGGFLNGYYAWDQIIAQLPEGQRPFGRLVFLQYGTGQSSWSSGSSSHFSSSAVPNTTPEGTIRVDINPDGYIEVVGGLPDTLSLSGISFLADCNDHRDVVVND